MLKSGKHCGKRRNCSKRAISSFVTMFLKKKASIWGKGLNLFHIETHFDTTAAELELSKKTKGEMTQNEKLFHLQQYF